MERDDDGKRSIVERVSADFAKVIRTNDFSKVYEEKVQEKDFSKPGSILGAKVNIIVGFVAL